MIVLNNYSKADNNFKALISKIEAIKKLYENVRITTEFGEPVTKEVDGMLVIEQNEISHVEITPEQVKEIIAAIKDARQFIVE